MKPRLWALMLIVRHHRCKECPYLEDKVAPLAVIHTLILQPLAVSLHATDLLAVVIRDGVSDGVRRGINAEALDSVVELLLFL